MSLYGIPQFFFLIIQITAGAAFYFKKNNFADVFFVHAFKNDEIHGLAHKTAVTGIKGKTRQQGRHLLRYQAAQNSAGLLEPCLYDFLQAAPFPFKPLLPAPLVQPYAPPNQQKKQAKNGKQDQNGD